jgi:hypothetical protein
MVQPVDVGPAVGTWSRARTPALIASSAVVLLVLGVVGWMAWRGPDDPTEPRTQGSAAAAASSAGIGNRTASPTSIRTTAPPPAGFKLVSGSGFTIFVPSSWNGHSPGWDNYRVGKAGSLIKLDVGYSARNEPMAADTMLIDNRVGRQNYKWLRLTRRLPTIEGAGSVAEQEYSDSAPAFPQWGYRRSITRAFVTTRGTGLYTVTVEVAANSPSALRRDWPKARPTFTTILNSFRLTSS